MCRFEYTDRCNKIVKIFDYMYFVYAIVLVLIVINNLFIKVVAPEAAFTAMFWVMTVVAFIEGLIELYKAKCVALPSLDFTMQYDEINHDDPLQKSVVAQAIEYATSWAEFALKREKSRIRYSGIYKITFAVLMVLCLIF